MRRFPTAATLLAVAIVSANAIGRGDEEIARVQACCTAATSATTQTTGQYGFTSTTTTNCRYDKATNKSTCTNSYEDSVGTKTRTVSVTAFAAMTHAVDEVKVIPPLRLSLRTDTTTTGSRRPIETSMVNTYDEQRRLTKEVAASKNGTTYTTTYASWDKSGRPTAGSTVFAKAPTTTLKIAYDEATRTVTTTTGTGTQWITCDLIYDANGNSAATSCKSQGGPSSDSKTTTTATEKICR